MCKKLKDNGLRDQFLKSKSLMIASKFQVVLTFCLHCLWVIFFVITTLSFSLFLLFLRLFFSSLYVSSSNFAFILRWNNESSFGQLLLLSLIFSFCCRTRSSIEERDREKGEKRAIYERENKRGEWETNPRA